jgi:uncharacterized membrane protein
MNALAATSLPPKLKSALLPAAVFVLVVLHGVGLWGLLFSGQPEYFQRLTPFNLLVSNLLLFAFHRDWKPAFVLFMIVVALIGYLTEVAGVYTGILFGNYSYGESLGWKAWNVPLLIAVNWLMLVYASGIVARRVPVPRWARILIASVLMVLMDFLIEPVAIRFDFWTWHEGVIPISNFFLALNLFILK